MDLQKPIFESADVCRVTGLTPTMIQNWVNRHVVEPAAGSNPGLGRRRLYSAVDIIMFDLIRRLVEFGLSPSVTAHAVKQFAVDAGPDFVAGLIQLAREGKRFWLVALRTLDGQSGMTVVGDFELQDFFENRIGQNDAAFFDVSRSLVEIIDRLEVSA